MSLSAILSTAAAGAVIGAAFVVFLIAVLAKHVMTKAVGG